MDLIHLTPRGLYCPAGDFYIDPWGPVPQAVLTHAHADHARPGSASYHATQVGLGLLRQRLGKNAVLHGLDYSEALILGDAQVSLHPAGHVLGSAQVRVQVEERVWVVTGDYKRDPDPTCAPFEVVPCDTLITEATFALPVYRWPSIEQVVGEIFQWWEANRAAGRTSVLLAYSLGKAQRVMAELCRFTDHPVYVHRAVAGLNRCYREAGIKLLPERTLPDARRTQRTLAGELIIVPPGALSGGWMRRLEDASLGLCSGWMLLRSSRRQAGYERGFILSDHADWPGLLRTVQESGARRVLTTHGQSEVLARYLRELGIDAWPLETPFGKAENNGG